MEVVRSFEDVYQEALRQRKEEIASAPLKPLLQNLHGSCVAIPANYAQIQDAIITLLTYLTTADGRTDANCKTVDAFIEADENGIPWQELPEQLGEVLGDMSGALHDAVSHAHIAENFDSTPEQILERALLLPYCL